ncbi:DUF6282 family protein [Psychromicrobium lacuslunae]|uniref:Amidohydrolase-related domain-containing protein n=1 Tax=Psychromicrobium lacuslunae TaxID=1618207 RepID=A0A0D4C042_9MICC|nr:DUF6282 family protein [Psychromicrobium lacuslunae]AJT41721.1 hypothetical protein UM93_09720 [Psychromicrobium lacuslunae]
MQPDWIDPHYHASQDEQLRRHSVPEAAAQFKALNAWGVIKSHQLSSVDATVAAQGDGLPVSGSIVLNDALGEPSPALVADAAKRSQRSSARLMVYWPTRPGRNSALLFTEAGSLTKLAAELLGVIRDHDAVLATGHAGRPQVFETVQLAAQLGLARLLVTHAYHPMSGLSLADIEQLGNSPQVFIEQTALTVLMARREEAELIAALRAHPRSILSSDLGQPANLALADFPAWRADFFTRHRVSAEESSAWSRQNAANLLFAE